MVEIKVWITWFGGMFPSVLIRDLVSECHWIWDIWGLGSFWVTFTLSLLCSKYVVNAVLHWPRGKIMLRNSSEHAYRPSLIFPKASPLLLQLPYPVLVTCFHRVLAPFPQNRHQRLVRHTQPLPSLLCSLHDYAPCASRWECPPLCAGSPAYVSAAIAGDPCARDLCLRPLAHCLTLRKWSLSTDRKEWMNEWMHPSTPFPI